jgi:magnesium transporter
LALGQLSPKDWWRVLRHELLMGLALGLTLGAIGFVRGATTPQSILDGAEIHADAFEVLLPPGNELPADQPVLELPPGTRILASPLDAKAIVHLPSTGQLERLADRTDSAEVAYRLPAQTEIRFPAAIRWPLALVIAQSVAAICLWGTIVGSMLPLVFRQLGFDPGFASSPFVATFVDVTGIVIYFSIAKTLLL